MWVQSLDGEEPLEGLATHPSILTWRIPWTEEPGRLYIVHRVAESDTTEATQHAMHISVWDEERILELNVGDDFTM